MAHNIGRMFYFGEMPWHRLGESLPQPATLQEALAAGGLDWQVATVPLATHEHPSSPVPHRVAVVREDRRPGDPGRVLGVVHPEFRPLQNRDGAELFDQLFAPGTRKYHTGGYLKQGEVVWLLARLPREIVVNERDVVEPYLLYTNSHDGSIAVDIRLSTIRVVCNNTLSLALHDRSGRTFRRRHRFQLDALAAQAQDFFAFTRRCVEETEESFRNLAARTCADAAFRRFLANLLPDPAKPASAATSGSVAAAYASRLARVRAARSAIARTRDEGIPEANVPPESPTWWGSLNAVTAWVDHAQATEGSRYAHAMFGAGDRLKAAAHELAIAEART